MPEGHNYSINITSGSIIRAALFVVLFVFLYFIRDLLLVILAAVVVASSVEPATNWLGRHKVRRLPAVVLVYLFLAGFLAVFIVFFLPSVLTEAIAYLNNLPESIRLSDIWNPIRDTGLLNAGDTVSALSSQSFSVKDIIDGLRSLISGTAGGAFKTVSIIFGGALSFILMIVLSFYLAVQEDGVANFLKIVSPVSKHDYIIHLWKRSRRKIGYWMQGQLVLGIFIGILVYLCLLVLGVKHALLLASLAAVFELIPIFGPILSAIPAVLIATVDSGVTQGVVVIGLYLIIHQFENHLLYPLVVKKIVGVSPILVIIALIVGVKLAGFLGALLAVPVAAVIMEYVEDIEKEKAAEKEAKHGKAVQV